MLKAISPIDGRYASKTADLQDYFSEYALIKFRVLVEIKYLLALANAGLPQVQLSEQEKSAVGSIFDDFSETDASSIKETEKITNHDVKAVEYFIKNKLTSMGLERILEFVHFALTSQDINNTVLPLQIKAANEEVVLPALRRLIANLKDRANEWMNIPLLARTHGQPASPTTMGKEWMVFIERLEDLVVRLESVRLKAKFGGATGQFNAHVAAFPKFDWVGFSNDFIESLGVSRAQWTTQIAHYDDHAEIFQTWSRIDTVLKDLCMDVWTYISLNYFTQKTKEGEIGSSAMPHKVNPIDFENAEGNLGLAIAIFNHLANKLPVSRLQRDLTDSTVSRNIGVPFAHTLISIQSIEKGLSKLVINVKAMDADLEANWAVVAEAIQNILRREGYPKPYEALLELTRGKEGITKETITSFIDNLEVSDEVKRELRSFSPQNYLGILGR